MQFQLTSRAAYLSLRPRWFSQPELPGCSHYEVLLISIALSLSYSCPSGLTEIT